jgi:hypothetical protein
LEEFLTRALLSAVPITSPDVLASFLASYAREALVKIEPRSSLKELEDVRKALEDVVRLRGENAKNGEGRSVTLSGDLADVMERRKAQRRVETKTGVLLSAYVFHQKGEPVGDFRKGWATACVAAGLGQFVCDHCNQTLKGHSCEECNREARYVGRIFHDFRRTAVRNMVRAGVPERVAMTISGHKTRSIFDRYNIVNEADLREAMQRTQSYLRNESASHTNHSKTLTLRRVAGH